MRRTSLVVIVLLAMSACSSSDGEGKTTGAATTPPGSPAASGTGLTIEGFAYSPTPLTVPAGSTVQVTNKDGQDHTVTSDAKNLFLADDVKQGTPVSFKVPNKAGTYTFHCEYHSSMKGTLVVTS